MNNAAVLQMMIQFEYHLNTTYILYTFYSGIEQEFKFLLEIVSRLETGHIIIEWNLLISLK